MYSDLVALTLKLGGGFRTFRRLTGVRRSVSRTPTHRLVSTFTAWSDLQWEKPDRRDWYLMSIACEVRRVLNRNPNGVKPSHFKLRFEGGKPKRSRKQQVELDKAVWTGMMTMPVEVVYPEVNILPEV